MSENAVMTREEWEAWRRRMGKQPYPATPDDIRRKLGRAQAARKRTAEDRARARERRAVALTDRIRELEEEIYRLRGGQRVYFMEFETTIKIGTSINPQARARHLGGRLLGHIPGSTELEASLHREWAHIRVVMDGEGGSEHFAKTPALVDFVEQQLSASVKAVKVPRPRNEGSGRA